MSSAAAARSPRRSTSRKGAVDWHAHTSGQIERCVCRCSSNITTSAIEVWTVQNGALHQRLGPCYPNCVDVIARRRSTDVLAFVHPSHARANTDAQTAVASSRSAIKGGNPKLRDAFQLANTGN